MQKIILRVLTVVVVAGVVGSGVYLYRASRPTSYAGGPAAAVAKALGCQNYTRKARTSPLAQFHDQGNCELNNTTVKVTTFNNVAEQQAYTILIKTLVPAYTRHSGAYAEGDGWVVADDVNLSKNVAVSVSNRIGGSVHEFAATANPSPSKS